ncbi:ISAzo13-like element transposase-related protein [Leptolyngbya sp. AN03gr2]|uniref:ISAzo13-like element transposase-related protein n=1 Tax=unclassified Leptolyngbya TaxID=2650499 RepID=UPI003D31A72C
MIVDCLGHWWRDHQDEYQHLDELMIDLAGGSATRSNRTQFIKRMVEFAQMTHLQIHLVYYPPYHSKYNPIERCWAALEHYWNGTVLDSVETAIHWATNMTWNGISPVVHLLDTVYEKGIKVPLLELEERYLPFWLCSETLPKWDITIILA